MTIETPQIDPVKRIKELNSYISQFNLSDGLDLCRFISNYILRYDEHWIYTNNYSINLWFIAYLAKQLLLFASDKNKKILSVEELKQISREFTVISENSLNCFSDKYYSERIDSQLKAEYERRFWQEPIISLLPRIWYTLVEPPLKKNHDIHNW